MAERDLILDGNYMPTYDEIFDYMEKNAQNLWADMNAFIQQNYKTSPKIMYSKCSGKPGWNVKYRKSGKSLCTLYPEKESFVALVVIPLDMVPIIEVMSEEFEAGVLEIVKSAKPFNGTRWLMIEVKNEAIANNVKQLLLLKYNP